MPSESSIDCPTVFSCSLTELKTLTQSRELHRSCKEYGYFFINDFDTSELQLENIFSEALRFFNLPELEKLKNLSSQTNQYLGYRRLGTEKSVLTGAPELCEQYKFGYFHDKNLNSTSLLLNYLTSYEPIFRNTQACFYVMEQIASELLRIIAQNFNLERNYFQAYCSQPMHQLGLNYYPTGDSSQQRSQNYAMSAHKDLCLLTLIGQNQGGLMTQNLQGKWEMIPHRENTLLVLLGDYLERWTNGYYLAPLHQVVESSNSARISVIYKHRPNYETIIPFIEGINPEKDRNVAEAEFHTGKAYENKINYIMSGI